MDPEHLQQRFYETRHGREILRCIQCGTCSGSCPLSESMDHAPREIFALIRDGEMDAVLKSNTPWFCVSCYQCMVRCPQEIPVTDLMYTLKQMAVEIGQVPATLKTPHLYEIFEAEIKQSGRTNGTLLMVRYGFRHPFDMLGKMMLGLSLFSRKRLELFSPKVKNPRAVRRILTPGPQDETR